MGPAPRVDDGRVHGATTAAAVGLSTERSANFSREEQVCSGEYDNKVDFVLLGK